MKAIHQIYRSRRLHHRPIQRVVQCSALLMKGMVRYMHRYRRRTRRIAARRIQVYGRAYLLYKCGICKRTTALAIVFGMRHAYSRCLYRMVTKSILVMQVEEKRKKPALNTIKCAAACPAFGIQTATSFHA